MTTWMLLFVVIRLYVNFRSPRGLAIDDCKIHILKTQSFTHRMDLDFCGTATVLSIAHTGVILSSR